MEIKINTEFNIGDKVFYFDDIHEIIRKGIIAEIELHNFKDFSYRFTNSSLYDSYKIVAKTKEELKLKITQNYIDEVVNKL